MTRNKAKPLFRQFLVSAGLSISIMEHALVAGYTAILLPQLRAVPSFELNDSSASWIASIFAFANLVAVLFVPPIIGTYGRRLANLISAFLVMIGWLSIALASNITTILVARFLQGIGLGITNLTAAVMISEYTTPKYRGAFVTMMCIALLSGCLIIHTVGWCLTWTNTAYFCFSIAIIDFIMIIISPESPLFLATCGKYDECRKVFHWLRGYDEEAELEAMIKADTIRKRAKTKIDAKDKIKNVLIIVKKSEFFKPLIIMLHLQTCTIWSGSLIMDAYGEKLFHLILGKDINFMVVLVTMDIVRIAATFLATVLNTKVSRRLMVMVFINLNILTFILTAVYYYAKQNQWLVGDHYILGSALIYFQMFTIGAGTHPIVNIIQGEIFPVMYKNIGVTLMLIFVCICTAMELKTLPYLLTTVGLHGTYCIFAALMFYGLVVAVPMLPEMKDLTLQNIEEKYWIENIEPFSETKLDEYHGLVDCQNK